ncbi:MAG: hypothetical protein EXS05_06730 [Planctomycetaceae bacterium]|nr:hypothetical protein [Planctomycetaceae bacterium]
MFSRDCHPFEGDSLAENSPDLLIFVEIFNIFFATPLRQEFAFLETNSPFGTPVGSPGFKPESGSTVDSALELSPTGHREVQIQPRTTLMALMTLTGVAGLGRRGGLV